MLLRALRLSSQTLSRILFKRRSALTSASSAEPAGNTISSTSLPKSTSSPERAGELGAVSRADVNQGDALGDEPPTRQLATYADERGDKEFHLMPIGMPRDPGIAQTHHRFARFAIFEDKGFMADAAVAGAALQRLSEGLGRRQDEIPQAEIATVEFFGELEPQKIIVELFGRDFKECHLALGTDPLSGIIDLLDR